MKSFNAGHILGPLLSMMPFVAMFAPLGIAPLLVTAALAGLLLKGRLPLDWPCRDVSWKPALVLGAIVVWALISTLWSLDPVPSALAVLPVAGNFLAGAVLVGTARRLDEGEAATLRHWVSHAILAGAALLLVMIIFPGFALRLIGIFHPNALGLANTMPIGKTLSRAVTNVTIAAPLAAMLFAGAGQRLRALAVLGLALGCVALAGSMAATMGTAFAAATAALALWRKGWAPRLVAGMIVGWIALAPLVFISVPPPEVTWEAMRYRMPSSSHHRLTIWNFAAQRVAEKPVLGWGFDAARRIPGGEDMIELPDGLFADGSPRRNGEQMMPLHPHNAVIQWWLELGGVGAALLGVLIMVVARGVPGASLNRFQVAAITGSFSAAFVVACVSYGAWQNWWLSSLWIMATLVVLIIRGQRP